MLTLLILLSCLISILIITLFKVENINRQIIIFEIVVVVVLLFKLIFNYMIKQNNSNTKPLNTVELTSLPLVNNKLPDIVPHNFNISLNSPTPNEVLLNNLVANNVVHNVTPEVNNVNNTNNVNNLGNNNLAVNLVNNKLVLDVNNISNKDGCLLEDCGCKNVTQNDTCLMKNNDSASNCPSCSFTEKRNGNHVDDTCLKNNTLNYGDVLNVDSNSNNNLNNVLNTKNCAIDNSCVINSDSTNLHFDSPFSEHNDTVVNSNPALDSKTVLPIPNIANNIQQHQGPHPGDPEFTEVKDFWKLKKNNNDLCYIKRVLPDFYCEQ